MKSIKKLVKFIQKSKLTELEESIFRARLISDIDITLEDDYFMNREKRRVFNK